MNWVPSLLWGCFGFGRGAEQCGWNFRKSDVTNDERWAFYLGHMDLGGMEASVEK
jgi:hypothetical protein